MIRFLLPIALLALPASAETADLPGILGAEAVRALLVGNEATLPLGGGNDRVMTLAFDGSGSARIGDGVEDSFEWRVADDGMLCLEPAPTGMVGCTHLRRTEGALMLFDRNGNIQGAVSEILIGGR